MKWNARYVLVIIFGFLLLTGFLSPEANALQLQFNTVYSGSTPSRSSPLAILTLTNITGGVHGELFNNSPLDSGQFISRLYLNLTSIPCDITYGCPLDAHIKSIGFGENKFKAGGDGYFDVLGSSTVGVMGYLLRRRRQRTR